MKVLRGFPPNYDRIRAVLRPPTGAIFTYGDTIYNPQGGRIPEWLLDHEKVHEAQQAAAGGPSLWWGTYLTDKTFRFTQELEAHRAELRSFMASLPTPNRRRRRHMLKVLVRRLCGPLYGNLVTAVVAKQLLLKEIENADVS